jgi:exosortase
MTKQNQLLVFAVLCAVSILFWWHPLGTTLGLAFSNDAYTHIILILPLGLSLLYLDRDTLRAPFQGGVGVGSAVLVLDALLAGFARWIKGSLVLDGALSIKTYFWLIGGVIRCFGVETFRSLLFPLCFLFWMVPLPAFLLDRAVQFLQYESAFASRILFLAIGVPVTQDGVMLSIPNLDIEVATECSSIRSSMILIVITIPTVTTIFISSPAPACCESTQWPFAGRLRV